MNSQTLRILSIVLALSAILLGYFGLRLSAVPPEPVEEARPPQETTNELQVIIARRNIAAGRRINESDLGNIQVPVRREGSYHSNTELIEQVAAVPIAAGEIILKTHFQAGGPMARLLADGERAVAISVTEVIGSGGYVQPGDYVDVLVYLRGSDTEVQRTMTRTVMERVQVLAYGKALALGESGHVTSTEDAGNKADTVSRSAVLAVPRGEVEKLMLAENAGVIRLAVISSLEAGNDSRAATVKRDAIGLDELTSARRGAPRDRVPIHRGTSRTFMDVTK